MASRLDLQDEFCDILKSKNVYYNPPESIKMNYPCVVYSATGVVKHNANDRLYKFTKEYRVTVIDLDPDSEIPYLILKHFPMCSFSTNFISENLYHTVLTLYY